MKELNNYITEKLHIDKNITDQKNRDPYDAKSFMPGDILDGSFVYSSKHPYFYKVVKNNGKTVTCIQIDKKITRDDGYGQNGWCLPVPEKVLNDGHEIKARINKWGKIKMGNATCKLWNGKEVDFYTD